MRHQRMAAVLGAFALGATGLTATATATAAPTSSTSTTGAETSYVVLADRGSSATALAKRLEAKGATVTSVNEAVGMVTVTSTDTAFAAQTRAMDGVFGAAGEGVVGRSPQAKKKQDAVERPGKGADKVKGAGSSANSGKGKHKKGAADPLDDKLWGMDTINARDAHKVEAGDKRVKVGIIDTGVDGSHPDIAPNFDPQALAQLRHRHPRHRRTL